MRERIDAVVLSAGPALPSRRASRKSGRPSVATPLRFEIPIMDQRHRVIGWTQTSPEFELGGNLRHPEAERLLVGPIVAVYVRLDGPADAQRAGAPPGWREPWRCLGICSADALSITVADYP